MDLIFQQAEKDEVCHCDGEKYKAGQFVVLPILNKAIRKDLTGKSDILSKSWGYEPNRCLREHSRQRNQLLQRLRGGAMLAMFQKQQGVSATGAEKARE